MDAGLQLTSKVFCNGQQLNMVSEFSREANIIPRYSRNPLSKYMVKIDGTAKGNGDHNGQFVGRIGSVNIQRRGIFRKA